MIMKTLRAVVLSLSALVVLAAPAAAFGPKDLPVQDTAPGFGPKDLPEQPGPARSIWFSDKT
jgi:hypothetical protein